MPAVTNLFEHGPITYTVSASTSGGQLVAAQSDGTVAPAAADSTAVLGVAVKNAEPSDAGASSTTAYGEDVVDVSWPRPEVAVAYRGVYRVTYAAAASFGDLLVAAASGQVTPYTAGTSTFDQIVGRCVETGGVAAAGDRGKTMIGTAGSA